MIEEAVNIREHSLTLHHIDFLQSEGYLTGELETLDLENLPDVQGLRSLRVGVNLESRTLFKRAENM